MVHVSGKELLLIYRGNFRFSQPEVKEIALKKFGQCAGNFYVFMSLKNVDYISDRMRMMIFGGITGMELSFGSCPHLFRGQRVCVPQTLTPEVN